jgi:hypothetical protein
MGDSTDSRMDDNWRSDGRRLALNQKERRRRWKSKRWKTINRNREKEGEERGSLPLRV